MATVKCIENRLNYDIWIMATPCDGIKECRDGSDEQCDENKWNLIGIVSGLVMITVCIYNYLKWHVLNWNEDLIINMSNDAVDHDLGACSNLLGDDLAKLKVNYICNALSICYNILLSALRILKHKLVALN